VARETGEVESETGLTAEGILSFKSLTISHKGLPAYTCHAGPSSLARAHHISAMATTIPANPTSSTVNQLLQKINDPDPDFRFMALNDLLTVLSIGKPDLLHHDYNTATRTCDNVVKSLDDQNGEVQNQAIKW
jgi:hypothetical protein